MLTVCVSKLHGELLCDLAGLRRPHLALNRVTICEELPDEMRIPDNTGGGRIHASGISIDDEKSSRLEHSILEKAILAIRSLATLTRSFG